MTTLNDGKCKAWGIAKAVERKLHFLTKSFLGISFIQLD